MTDPSSLTISMASVICNQIYYQGTVAFTLATYTDHLKPSLINKKLQIFQEKMDYQTEQIEVILEETDYWRNIENNIKIISIFREIWGDTKFLQLEQAAKKR